MLEWIECAPTLHAQWARLDEGLFLRPAFVPCLARAVHDMLSRPVQRSDVVVSGRLLRIARVPEAREDYLDVDSPDSLVAVLRAERPTADIFTFWQRLPDTEPRFAYKLEWDNVAALRITSYDDWTRIQVHPSVRTKLRKARKLGLSVGLEVFDQGFVEGIAGIFSETPFRQGRPYEHYGKTTNQIRNEWSADADASVFIGARFDGELIGFVKLTSTERYAEMSGTICKLAHRDKPAMSAMIGQAVQYCSEAGIPWLTYGRYHYGNKGDDSLSQFKRYNGFEKVNLPRYFVPITTVGRIALMFGLHKRLPERLPPRLVRSLVRLRAEYYSRKLAAGAPPS